MTGEGVRPPHAVLLREPARFDAQTVAVVLAANSKLPAETLLPVVRRGWGIVAEPSSAEDAEALAAALTAAGRPALAAPVSLIEEPPPPVVVLKGELAGDGFDVDEAKANAPRERLSWSRLRVLAAGQVTETSTKTVTEGPSVAEKSVRLGVTLATGIPVGRGKETQRRVTEERSIPFIEMLFVARPAKRVRIMAAAFDYSVLGPKMGYSAELNFRALVAELAARAPSALRSRGARAILEKAPSGRLAYESFDDAGRELRWLGTLVALEAAL